MTTVHNLSVKDGALTMSRELLDPSALSICLMNPEVNLKAPPRAPGLLRMALETRFPMELGIGLTSLPFLMTATGGDGHCVIVIPGLAASDDSTGPLRYYLRHLGYDALKWSLGRNLGLRPGVLEACEDLAKSLCRKSGRKVSLVGWSLGGVYAREIAKLTPESVRCVITLGTPLSADPDVTNASSLYKLLNGDDATDKARWAELSEAPPVPTTSIYSRSDGIVPWQASVQRSSASAENIEVDASHIGLGFNPAALYAVADRLAQPEGCWAPFKREGMRRLIFRDPEATDWFPNTWLV